MSALHYSTYVLPISQPYIIVTVQLFLRISEHPVQTDAPLILHAVQQMPIDISRCSTDTPNFIFN